MKPDTANDSTSTWLRQRDGRFNTTHWSVVVEARHANSPRAAAALESLLKTYWYPVYAFVRRQGNEPEDAQDLAQAFFIRLLARRDFASVDQSRGRFRNFLLASLKHFLANEWDRSSAQKRGGAVSKVPIEPALAENWYAAEPLDHSTPESIYERQWACALLDRVMSQLTALYAERGQAELFGVLKHTLLGETNGTPYSELATRFGLTEAALKMRVQRLRMRYQRLLREEIAATVSDREYVEDEIAHLFAIFNG